MQPQKLHDGLIKVNLTDFISGKYSLSYERVIGPWTTAEFTVTGIGMTTSDYTYTIAQASYYPYSSFYPSLPADMTTEMSGWEVSGAVRKYGWVDDGVPDGFYASAFLMAGGVTIEADERCALWPSTRTPCSGNLGRFWTKWTTSWTSRNGVLA